MVVSDRTREQWHLSGAAESADEVRGCATRYVLSDELATLCTDLAYSRGARVFGCMDLLRIPAERLWVEWSYHPWLTRMSYYGFKGNPARTSAGRCGILLQASPDGLSGSMRSFWNFGPSESEVFADAVVTHFRLDGPLETSAAACSSCLRVNAARARLGKQLLLDHIEVRAPIFANSSPSFRPQAEMTTRRGPRLHHVRGHLVRRANQLFWRVPHLRGSARRGVIKSRTVTWIVGGTSIPAAPAGALDPI